MRRLWGLFEGRSGPHEQAEFIADARHPPTIPARQVAALPSAPGETIRSFGMNPASFEIVDGVPTYKLFIDGTWAASSRNMTADSINPADGTLFARTQQAGAPEVAAAIEAAHRAFASWGRSLASD